MRTNRLRIGIAAGLWAGFVSSAPGLVHALRSGEGVWKPIRLVATPLGLPSGRSFAPTPVAVGGLIHVGLSAFYGAMYAAATPAPAPRPALRGVGFGLLLHLVNLRLIARLRPFRQLRQESNEAVELMAHAIYGAALGRALRER